MSGIQTRFEPEGPFEIHPSKEKRGRTFTKEDIDAFWEENPDYAEAVGCYVFAIRAGRGFKPWYVGKTVVGFKKEVFQSHKLQYYQQAIVKKAGTPVMFFVTMPVKQGKVNAKHISRLEDFLIQVASRANAELLNVKGKKSESWSIEGIVRGKAGKPSTRATALKKCLNL